MIGSGYVRHMARYNRWQNESLYGVADALPDEDGQPVDRVPDVRVARVERRQAEADAVRPAEVGDDVRMLDQRPADPPRIRVA